MSIIIKKKRSEDTVASDILSYAISTDCFDNANLAE